MILYKALYDYQSKEICDLSFRVNDIIEYLSQSSSSWYKGKNITTGKSGLFPYNFVSKLNLPENETDLYAVIEDNNICNKGEIVVAKQVQECEVVGYILSNEEKVYKTIPLQYLKAVKEKCVNFKFTKCVANSDSNGDLNQLPFSVGDIIWMTRKIDDSLAQGIINGKKGTFALMKVDIEEEEKFPNIDRQNKWIALFDYNSEDKNDLKLVHSEKLKFLDRIDNNWILMQNEEGKVGMVPCNFVKNISIKGSPKNKKFEEKIDVEVEELRANMPLKPIINELTNYQQRRVSCNEVKKENQAPDVMTQETKYNTIITSDYNQTDENVFDGNNVFITEQEGLYNRDEPAESFSTQFEQREKVVEDSMEVLMADILSIKNKLSQQDSDAEDVQMMTNNLSFLKEEYKEKQKQLSFIKQQKETFLNGISDEIDESDYYTLLNNEEMNKKYTTRSRAIDEILETENKFINDLKLTLKVFNPSEMENKISDQDYNSIFGDLEAIISVSERFYSDLSQGVDNFAIDVPIGSIFLKFLNSFETVYKEYCINYDRKLELINKKSKSQEIEEFIKEGLKRLNECGTSVSYIDAMLVKPLQRFLKYPLFMNIIIINTNEGNTDISDLRNALIEFERIAKKINEKKRFEELRTEIFDRNGQWHHKTLHAIQKVPKRLFVASLYGSHYDDDLDYRSAVLKFKKLKKCVSFFIDTLVILRDNLKELLLMYSSINEDLSQIISSTFGSELHQYILICKNGESNYYKKYISALESLVVNPLTKLCELFSGPKILIKKRKSKFLDYLGMKQKIEDKEVTRIQADKLEELKNQYLAINNTLKEELPILTSKSTVIFNECLANYLQLNTLTIQLTIDSLRSLIGKEDESLEEEQRNCRNKQSEILNYLQKNILTYNSRNDVHRVELSPTNPRRYRSDSVSRTEYYCQTEEDITNLKLKYESRNLGYVKKDFIPTKPHQIYVSTGNIVGIIKRCDPQGHASSWLVEVCAKRVGFVPRSYLNSVPFSSKRQSSFIVSPTVSRTIYTSKEKRYSLLDNTEPIDLMQFSPNSPDIRTKTLFNEDLIQEIRIARFDFKSTGQTDISMNKNDKLQLIESHDKTGNTSWSLVKNLRTGAQGYVPTNYMTSEAQ